MFLARDRAYKVKKPVVFPFLDYGTAARRRQLCEEEVRLNGGLAPDLYLGVRGLAERQGSWELVDADDVAAREWAVEMRRFDEGCTLASRLRADRVGDEHVAALARLIADFHRDARSVYDGGSRIEAWERATGDNFDELGTYPETVPKERLAAARRLVAAFLSGHGEVLEQRGRAGLVRECHGDLRAEHVLLDGEIQVFDCVEFARHLREIDVAADLAFLVMDLTHAGRDDLAALLVNRYRDAGGDPGSDQLLSFFAAYRAWVRAKVACARAGELDIADERRGTALGEARGFAATARRFEWRARGGEVIVLCGLSGAGKTYLAARLHALTGRRHLNSDAVRKGLWGLRPDARAPREAYAPAVSQRTYAELGRRARAEVEAGRGVIVDATFRFRRDGQAFLAELGDNCPLFVECRAPAAVLAERALRRQADPARVSDAGVAEVELQQREFEPLTELAPEGRLALSTDRPADELLSELERRLDERLAAG